MPRWIFSIKKPRILNRMSTVTYRAIIDGSRDSHSFVVHKDCEIFEIQEGILFKTKINLKH